MRQRMGWKRLHNSYETLTAGKPNYKLHATTDSPFFLITYKVLKDTCMQNYPTGTTCSSCFSLHGGMVKSIHRDVTFSVSAVGLP
jgi:hypothetical protein